MPIAFSDDEIESLVEERKLLSDNWRGRIRRSRKPGHNEAKLDIEGMDGSQFQIIGWQSMVNRLDFSVILTVEIPQSNKIFRLRRYNGKSHEHTNNIEKETFYDFHIHRATERYQELGTREDGYAETTDRYSDYNGALACLMDDANVVHLPKDIDRGQMSFL